MPFLHCLKTGTGLGTLSGKRMEKKRGDVEAPAHLPAAAGLLHVDSGYWCGRKEEEGGKFSGGSCSGKEMPAAHASLFDCLLPDGKE